MAESYASLQDGALSEVFERNPDFDLLRFDFHDPASVAALDIGEHPRDSTVETLKAQRRIAQVAEDPDVADALLSQGWRSAHAIAATPRPEFVRRAEAAGIDAGSARGLHARAVSIKAATQHLFANLKNQLGDPYFRASRAFNADPSLEETAQSIPSYQDLFGTLNYITCQHCQSIFGPAAYFLDLMRIAEDYVTAPNTGKPGGDNIPDAYLLRTRRPDLFELKLTCENTDRLVPYLEVVNRVLERHIEEVVGGDPWQNLAAAPYPFNLPFNLPLVEMRDTLEGLRTSLAEIYAVLASGNAAALEAIALAITREYIGLSIEQLAVVSTPQTTPEGIGPYYGYPAITPGVVEELAHVEAFLARTGLTRDQLLSLLYQETSALERPSVAPGFFINATGESGVAPFMSVVLDRTDPEKVFERIAGLTLARLDRINRFVRLAMPLGWSFANLDWAMKSVDATAIADCIEPFAGIKRLVQLTGFEVDQLIGFWYRVKNVGIGDRTDHRIDLFDRVFNDPRLLKGRNPYNPAEHVPFDPARPQDWTIRGTSLDDSEIRARLGAALLLSDDDLTAAADYLALLTGTGEILKTDLPTLSALYRLAGSARAAAVTMGEYLLTLTLLYGPPVPPDEEDQADQHATIPDALEQSRTASWMRLADINAYQLSYMITGEGFGYVDPGYRAADIRPLIESLATISAGARLGPANFVFDTIDAADSAAMFDYLRGLPPATIAYVSPIGIFKPTAVTFAVLAPAFPVHEADLVTGEISADEASEAFEQLIANRIILAAAGATQGPIAETFGPQTSLDFLFTGKPLAQEKRDQVRSVLSANKNAVDHSVSVCSSALKLQNQNAQQGLAQFLGTDAETMQVLIPFAAGKADLTEYLEALLTPIPAEGVVPPAVPYLIAIMARSLLLMGKLDLTPIEMAAVIADPADFGIVDTSRPSVHDVEALWTFKSLTIAFHDGANRLLAYFAMPSTTEAEKAAKLAALASLSGWPPAQIDTLVERFWPASDGYSTTQGVARMKAVFDIAAQSGLDVQSLIFLYGFATLPAVVNGAVDPAKWATYESGSDATLNALAAKWTEPDLSEVLKAVQDKEVEQKRDALLGFAIFQIHKNVPDITSPSDLYQYLLIDVEMTSCDSISFIAQGHASLQLYLQRCRLNLEPGVTELPIDEAWWSWISGYRLWEANRKIFLYPENYIEPSLRKGASAEFDALRDQLLQSEVTKDYAGDVYQTYMDDFAQLANLVISSSYRCAVVDPTTNKSVDTLFIFGRTATSPSLYYYRKCEYLTVVVEGGKASTKARWDPWRRMGVTIPSPWVTPVYAFGKLMVFWVEIEKTTNSIINAQQESENHTAWNAQIKYSFLTFRGEWVQPQLYASNAIIDFEPDDYLDKSAYSGLYDPAMLYWHKLSVVHVPPNRYAGSAPFSNGEQLLVLYGPRTAYVYQGTPPPLAPPDPTAFPEMDRLNQEIYQASLRAWALGGVVTLPPGRVPTRASMAVDSNLTQQGLFLALFNYYPGLIDSPPDYTGKIDGLTLKVGQYSSILDGNYYADSYNSPQQALLAQAAAMQGEGLLEPGPETEPEVNTPGVLLVNLAPANTALITVKNQPGWFVFDNGDDVFLGTWQTSVLRSVDQTLVLSNAVPGMPAGITAAYNSSYTTVPAPPPDQQVYAFTRLGTHTVAQLSQTLFTGGIDALLTIPSQEAKELPFSRFYADPNQPPQQVVNTTTDRLDFDGAYGPYFWEIFFHAVFLIADGLQTNQRYEEAKAWYEYIFDPTALPESGVDSTERYWRFLPFRNLTWDSLTEILTSVGQIAVYNDDPFDPHAIARLRPSAYPKSVVMHYIDNLLDWGDRLYALDTREAITQATNLYVLAADLLGPRPVDMGDFEPPVGLSYDEIAAAYAQAGTAQAGTATSITLDAQASSTDNFYNGLTITLTGGAGAGQARTVLDYAGATKVATVAPWATVPDTTTTYAMSGIPQFLIELEVAAPVGDAARAAGGFDEAPFNAIDSYFCIPENEEFIAYWDRVEDRLFKIRHCMDIHGIVRQLALFEPPLDVRALVRAAATGNLAAAVVSPTSQPVPAFRCAVMLDKAKALTGTLIGLSNSLLAAIQAGDGEALALLRNTQERAILDLTTRVRTDQIALVEAQRQALVDSRAAATVRAVYYKKLVAVGLSPGERTNLEALTAAMALNVLAGYIRTASSIGYAVPQFGSPFAMTYGGQQIGAVLNAVSGAAEIGATVATFIADRSLTMASYDRRAADWQLQADLADMDVKQIDAQIAANDIQAQIADQELVIHEKSIAQNAEMEAFLKRKFTNQELYQWLAGRLSTVYFQTYSLAFDLALAAQRAYQFETNTNESFINFGYWDNLRKGLMSGEGLMLGLNQMESSYLAKATRSFEIEKTVSLLQVNPKALLDLRETGTCNFELSERMFDQDYPGHYARRIKTVSVSLPAIVGPYQNIKATLTQTSNRVALTSDLATVRFLLGVDQGPLPGPERLRTDWQVNQQVALSSGVDDSGLFVLDFQDPRYLPFEGTGAVSTWRLTMPKAANRIDYNAISDVVIQLRYTAASDEKLRTEVVKLAPVKNYSGVTVYPLAQQWSDRWFAFMSDHTDPASQVLTIPLVAPIAPPQVEVGAVVAVSLHLEVLEGKSAAGSYLSIRFPGDTEATPIPINDANGGSITRRVTRYSGDWKLEFKLGVGGAPSTITDGGFLDPAKLLNVAMAVYYEGTLDWG